MLYSSDRQKICNSLYYKLERTGNILDFSIATQKPDDTWISDAFLSEDLFNQIKKGVKQ